MSVSRLRICTVCALSIVGSAAAQSRPLVAPSVPAKATVPAIAKTGTIPPGLYAHDSIGNVFRVNLTTGVATWIGNPGVVFTDIAFSPAGTLLGISNGNPQTLYRIDPQTAQANPIGAISGTGWLNALVFTPDGVLWAAGDEIATLNSASGAATPIHTLSPYASAGDLALDEFGQMYLTTIQGKLLAVSRANGAWTLIGSLPQSNLFGLARGADNTLHALSSNNNLYSVNVATGSATLLTTMSASFSLGLTYGSSFWGESAGPWGDAVDLGSGWSWSTWFGTFSIQPYPWIFHAQHGWMYTFCDAPESATLWDVEQAAFLWASSGHYPFLYRFLDGAWLWYLPDSDNPRWFYNMTAGTWEAQ